MTRKEIFFKILEEDFFKKSENFECKFSKCIFFKEIKNTRITLNYASRYNFGLLDPEYYIFIPEVELLKKKASGKDYFKFETITTDRSKLIINLNLKSEYETSFLIDSTDDTEAAARSELSFYYNFLKSEFFERYMDIQYLNVLLNMTEEDDFQSAHFLNTETFRSAELAICVAVLCGNNNLQEIKSRYLSYVTYKDHRLSFEKFCKYFGL